MGFVGDAKELELSEVLECPGGVSWWSTERFPSNVFPFTYDCISLYRSLFKRIDVSIKLLHDRAELPG